MILEVKNDMLTGKGTENALHLELIKKDKEIERLNNIIEDARKYLTSYESINTMQKCETPESNRGLDEGTFIEMTNRYLKVHDKLLNILELKEGK